MHRRLLLLCVLAFFRFPTAMFGQYTAPPARQTLPANTSLANPPVVCPWLTQGTAAKMLGGDVSVVANVSDSGEGSCKFAREQGSPDTLEIVVSKADLAGCPTNSIPLRAIGNEAVLCRRSDPRGQGVQMISSRVRDQHFTVTFTTRGREKAVKEQDPQDEPIARIAEQVAGSLF
jgi:hypothetical protein